MDGWKYASTGLLWYKTTKYQSTQTTHTYRVHRSTITTLQTKQHTSSHLLTFCAEKEVCDVSGVVDADADADDEHRRGDRVYRQI